MDTNKDAHEEKMHDFVAELWEKHLSPCKDPVQQESKYTSSGLLGKSFPSCTCEEPFNEILSFPIIL